MGDDPENDSEKADSEQGGPGPDGPEEADDWEYTLQVPRDPLAPCIARRTLRTIFQQHGFAAVADTAELLTSELLTNAYRYSDGPASVRVRGEGERVRVSVWDTNPKLPAPVRAVPPDGEAEQGRGLGLVSTCADSWGGFALRDQPQGLVGKLMWFELGAG